MRMQDFKGILRVARGIGAIQRVLLTDQEVTTKYYDIF